MKISILGAGSWGTALGKVLNEKGHDIQLWHFEHSFVEKINSDYNHPFLPGITLDRSLKFTSLLKEICDFGEIMISAVPSQALRSVLSQFPSNWRKPIVSVSKGIENKTGMRMSEVIVDVIGTDLNEICILSGPSHAEEVAQKFPTAIVSASINKELSLQVQKIFSNSYFRVYTSIDITGVELGGAAKNIIAVAAGICHGLGFGDNTIAALVTRGLEEIIRLGVSLGAERATISGLSGMGDLVVTAFSSHSRNRHVGIRIGKGDTLDSVLNNMEMVAEGVETTRSIYALAKKNNVEMPICNQIYNVLFNNFSPKQAILDLMGRELVDEHPV